SVNVVFQAPEGQKLSDPHNSQAIDSVIGSLRSGLGDLITDAQPPRPRSAANRPHWHPSVHLGSLLVDGGDVVRG
ncbi:hypothetical protein ACUY2L_05720, partial [Corynebacterium mastitidis]